MLTMLAMMLALQVPAEDSHFVVALEKSIYSFETSRNLDRVLPSRQAKLVRNLGCNRYDCREVSSEVLSEPTGNNLRALVWGTHMKDVEIASRCKNILDMILPCSHCSGTGYCPRAQRQYGVCDECYRRYTSTSDLLIDQVYYDKGCVFCLKTGH